MINECKTLREYVKPSMLPCRNLCGRIPSYYEEGKGKGCLVAHTVLCLYELKSILPIAERTLTTAFTRTRIYRRLKPQTIVQTLLELTTILHDIGKTFKNYGTENFKHELASAILTYKLISQIDRIKHPIANLKGEICLAILLHHESRYWRIMRKTVITELGTAISYQEIARYKPDLEKLKQLLEAAIKISSERKLLHNETAKIVEKIIQVIERKIEVKPSKKEIDEFRRLIERKGNMTVARIPPILYHILYTVDNRAASARTEYWRKTLCEIWRSMEKKEMEEMIRLLAEKAREGRISAPTLHTILAYPIKIEC